MPSPLASVPYYEKHAARLAESYDMLAFEQLHNDWASRLPNPGKALDVGAGTGRDALWLALHGWQVTAVEPADAMRELAARKTLALGLDDDALSWHNDALPALSSVQGQKYQLVLLSAVWMHLSVAHRPAAFKRLIELLAEDGMLVMTLRDGPNECQRPMYPVSKEEIISLGRPMGLQVEVVSGRGKQPDLLKRPDVRWQTLIIKREALRLV